jgi:di/tricarboxylate transporter
LVGKNLDAVPFSKSNLNLIAIQCEKKLIANPASSTVLHAGDILLLGNFQSDPLELGLVEDHTDLSEQVFADESHSLAELVLAPHSALLGKSLTEIGFKEKYEMNVLSVWRDGKPLQDQIKHLPLHFGDALLVQGSAEHIHQLHNQNDLILLEENPDAVLRPQRQWIAILITLVTLGFAALDILPVAEVVLLGAILLMLTGCMGITDVYQSIEWKAIFLIAGMWPLSIAIQQSGLANVLIDSILHTFGTISPLLMVTIFLTLAMVFTQLMSGQISAIVLIPLALTAATTLHISPQALGMAVALGCSLGFPTPLGHPVNIMVMNPGGYTFKDYLRVGLPLTALSFAVILVGIHFVYGL